MDACKVHVDKDVDVGVGEEAKITLKGEAIVLIKFEAASGLIYWTGKEYRWYQQGGRTAQLLLLVNIHANVKAQLLKIGSFRFHNAHF